MDFTNNITVNSDILRYYVFNVSLFFSILLLLLQQKL